LRDGRRTAFTFASFGHEHVSILDGGFPRWKAEGHEIEYGSPAPFEVRTQSCSACRPGSAPGFVLTSVVRCQSGFYPTPNSEATSTVGYDAVVANISSGESAVLDARPKPRFTAEAPEPRAGLPSGHVPGSRSLPFGELVKDGQLRSDEEVSLRTLARAPYLD
jgi:thiosulfate/3-mercaptopyruvate sulfurtransferase